MKYFAAALFIGTLMFSVDTTADAQSRRSVSTRMNTNQLRNPKHRMTRRQGNRSVYRIPSQDFLKGKSQLPYGKVRKDRPFIPPNPALPPRKKIGGGKWKPPHHGWRPPNHGWKPPHHGWKPPVIKPRPGKRPIYTIPSQDFLKRKSKSPYKRR